MELTLTTPALLFPAISLLLLAYTNRFLVLAALMRDLHARYRAQPDPTILAQLANVRYRIVIIRNMQACGVASVFGCVLCMFVLFAGQLVLGQWIFGGALLLLLLSLGLSLREIQVSIDALTVQIADLESTVDTQRPLGTWQRRGARPRAAAQHVMRRNPPSESHVDADRTSAATDKGRAADPAEEADHE